MTSEMRRDPKAIEAALDLDPARRELYVEGPHDRRLILWLLGDTGTRDSVVQDISSVDIPDVDGGNRGRLLEFARRVSAVDRVRYFADADWDRLLGRAPPSNGWLTDGRDMEAYLLLARSADKAIRVGVGRPVPETQSIVKQSLAASRRAAYLRIADDRAAWHLPFQGIPPWSKTTIRRTTLDFAERPWVTALLDASIGRTELASVIATWEAAATEFEKTPNHDIIHGKDFLGFLGEFLLKHGVERRSCPKLVWSALSRGRTARHPNIAEVLAFVAA